MTKLSLLNRTRQTCSGLFIAAGILLTACGGEGGGYPPISHSNVSGSGDSGAPASESKPEDTDVDPSEDSHADVAPPEDNHKEDEESAAGSTFVTLAWNLPDQRENGEYLEDYEIGGYELRLEQAGEDHPDYMIVDEGTATEYELGYVKGEFEILIAVYDIHGRYSDFIKLN